MSMTNQTIKNKLIILFIFLVRGGFVIDVIANKRLLSVGLKRPRLLQGLFHFIWLAGVIKRYFTWLGWLVIFALPTLTITIIIL